MFDLNTTWLKITYFTLTHKDDLRKWYIIVLLAVAVFTVVFVFTNLVLYLVGMPLSNRLVQGMAADTVDYSAIRQRNTPVTVQVQQTYAIPSGTNRFDVVAPVTNPNTDWFATVTYAVSVNGATGESQDMTLNPSSELYLTALGVGGEGSVSVQLAVEHIAWRRLDHHNPPPVAQFDIADPAYSTLTGEGATVYQVRADITNNSYVSFYEVPFIILLYNGDQIVGVNYAYISPFNFGETKTITAKWNTVGGTVTSARVVPALNLLDRSNIIE